MAAVLNRRSFFGLLGAVAAGAAFDPERALWVPRAKVYSIPAPRFTDLRVMHALITLQNSTQVARAMRGDYGQTFVPSWRYPLKVGDMIVIRVPQRLSALCLDGSYLLHVG